MKRTFLRLAIAATALFCSTGHALAAESVDLLGRPVEHCTFGAPVETFKQVGKYMHDKNYKEALRVCNNAISQAGPSTDPGLFSLRANVYRKLGLFDKAIEDYSSLVAKEPNDYLSRLQIANCWYDAGDLKKAETECSNALTLAPNLPEAVFLRAKIFYKQNKYKEALTDCIYCSNNPSLAQPEQTSEAIKMKLELEKKLHW